MDVTCCVTSTQVGFMAFSRVAPMHAACHLLLTSTTILCVDVYLGCPVQRSCCGSLPVCAASSCCATHRSGGKGGGVRLARHNRTVSAAS